MPHSQPNFHNFALQSSLFKGHKDWYFCLLKSERIAHVLTILAEQHQPQTFDAIVKNAHALPSSIAYLAAGEMEVTQILAEIFSLMIGLRLLLTQNILAKDTTRILLEEYEALSEKVDASTRLSRFITSEDFLLKPIAEKEERETLSMSRELSQREVNTKSFIKDNYKGQNIEPAKNTKRTQEILTFVKQNKGVSIKDITAVMRQYGEKTIQRELSALVREGLIRKTGERRWSLYEPISGV